MLRDIVWITTFPGEAAATRARELLGADGIASVTSEDPDQSTDPALPPTRGLRLGVRADDVRAALTILWKGMGK
jgi:hypothetical protein